MILTKEQMSTVNHFASEAGGVSLEKLAQLAYEYFANQAVLLEDNSAVLQAKGAAKFAMWLKTLPNALRKRED